MFDSSRKFTGVNYAPRVALLWISLVLCPAVSLATRPDLFSLSLAVGCGAASLTLAWISLNWSVRLSARTAARHAF